MKQVVSAVIVEIDVILKIPFVFTAQRLETQSFPLKWHMPGGKIEPGEMMQAAIKREMLEEFDALVEPLDLLARLHTRWKSEMLCVNFIRSKFITRPVLKNVNGAMKWQTVEALNDNPWIETDRHVAALALHEHGAILL